MRQFIQRMFVLVMVGVAAAVSGQAFAQSATAAPSDGTGGEDQITVRGKALSRHRLELEEARDELIEVYNDENSGEDNDVICREERPTGSRMPQRPPRVRQTRAGTRALK